MKPRFELHPEAPGNTPPPGLLDSESFEVSERQFAASLHAKPAESRFVANNVPDAEVKCGEPPQMPRFAGAEASVPPKNEAFGEGDAEIAKSIAQSTESVPSNVDCELVAASWRVEVAAKMEQYRAHKHPRSPRYPSLQLKFQELDFGATARALSPPPGTIGAEENTPSVDPVGRPKAQLESQSYDEPLGLDAPAPSGKILEFPAPLAPPAPAMDELAEAILDRPRILEVPDVIPPPPALGGILIEPNEEPARERRRGFELPLIAAPFSKRILAGCIDALTVAAGFAIYAYIFLQMTSVLPAVWQAGGIAAGLLAILWAAYQYLMLVHSGSTLGLKLAKLQLRRFDGSAVPLKLRRWRVLASLLSGLSLGLGYAWCFLDEDQLSWHDRITHTYMAPTTSE